MPRSPRFEDNSFDFIFEKACIDAQFASVNTYNVVLQINQEVRTRPSYTMPWQTDGLCESQVCRILKPGRNFMSISCAVPVSLRDPLYLQTLRE